MSQYIYLFQWRIVSRLNTEISALHVVPGRGPSTGGAVGPVALAPGPESAAELSHQHSAAKPHRKQPPEPTQHQRCAAQPQLPGEALGSQRGHKKVEGIGKSLISIIAG